MKTNNNNKHILLVEDESLIALDEKAILEDFGYIVDTVYSGEKAIDFLDSGVLPNLILMDIDLGRGMDGTECAAKILENFEIPILFISSHSDPKVIKKTEEITSYGYVPKGVNKTALNASIKMAFKLFEEKQQRQAYEDSLFKSSQMLRKIIDSIQQSIFWKDTNGKYLGCNKAFADTVNIADPQTIIGMTDYDMPWPKDEADAYIADDREVIKTEKSKIHIIEPLMRADGEHRIIDTSKHPLFDEQGDPFAIIGIYDDITEIMKAREYMQKKDSALAKLASQIPGMLYEFLMKPNGEFSVPYSSMGVTKIFGCTPEDVLNNFDPIFEAIYHEDRPLILKTIEESIQNLSQWKCEYRVQLPDEPIKWIYGNSIPEKQEDGSIKWYGYNVDISQQKAAENEIKLQLKSKVILLKEAHHRIKNNIASIAGLLSIQADTADNPEVKDALQNARSRIESVQLLYGILLSGDEYEKLQIKDYLKKIIHIILEIYQEEINFVVHFDLADFPILSQKVFPIGIILNEIITNIIKYAFNDKETGRVDVSLQTHNSKATLIIHDNGCGIDTKKLNQSTQGYGLSLISMLAEQIGGSFSIENSNGTINTLEFPIVAR